MVVKPFLSWHCSSLALQQVRMCKYIYLESLSFPDDGYLAWLYVCLIVSLSTRILVWFCLFPCSSLSIPSQPWWTRAHQVTILWLPATWHGCSKMVTRSSMGPNAQCGPFPSSLAFGSLGQYLIVVANSTCSSFIFKLQLILSLIFLSHLSYVLSILWNYQTLPNCPFLGYILVEY